LLKITNEESAGNDEEDDVLEYRYRKLFGTWLEWRTLKPNESAECPIKQSLEVEYRFTGRTRRLLVGAAAHLGVTQRGCHRITD